MIFDAIIGIGLGLISGLLALFPAYTLPGSMTGTGSSLGQAVATINGVFPVVTLGVCIAAVLGVRAFLGLLDLAVFIYGLVPFKAT